MTTAFMTTEEVAQLRASDVGAMCGATATVAESGPYLEEAYKTTPRYNFRGGVTGMFWEKVHEIVDILNVSEEWPFEPLEVSLSSKTLYNGHHRSNAAILAGWEKPIPVEVW